MLWECGPTKHSSAGGGATWVRRATGSVEAGTTGQDPDPVGVGFQGVALWAGSILEFPFPGCQGLFSM